MNNHIANVFHGMHILVAEDNRTNQFYIKHLLKKFEVMVTIVTTGKGVMDEILTCDSCYDLILMDLYMPVMNGLDTARCIRSHSDPLIKNIPIAACSGNDDDTLKQQALQSGIDYYITKPFCEKALTEILGAISTKKFESVQKKIG